MDALPSAQGEARPLVLLYEDAVMQRLELTETLEQVGFRVVPVVSTEEALAVVNTEPDIRVIVTDVKLSSEDLSGFALAQKLSRERKLASVLISGEMTPCEGEFPVGAHFVAEPVHKAALLRLIRDVISSTEAAIQLSTTSLSSQTLTGPELTSHQEHGPRASGLGQVLLGDC